MNTKQQQTPPSMNAVLERNIEALLARQRAQANRRGLQDRVADAISRFAGSMPFVYLHAGIFGAWCAINLGWTPLRPFDPTFVILATLASVEAIFLSTFVLITQNRMQRDADRRADLDLQISLLTEHELTRLSRLIGVLAERMGVDAARSPEFQDIKSDVRPEQVLDVLERKEQAHDPG
jgi:uncharacterized membrane protein